MLPQTASFERLGFRHPQFSDDVAWLPDWLQPHLAAMTFDVKEEEKDPQKRGGCSLKDTRKGLRLHLSGDDDSPIPAFHVVKRWEFR
ncbi:hypothetical protein V2J09_013325 [Rumex salicifolius]